MQGTSFIFLEVKHVEQRFSGQVHKRNCRTMIKENWMLVTSEMVEFEKEPVETQDYMKITDHFRGINKIYPNLIKENRKMSTCNRLDLQTLGCQPIDHAQKSSRSLGPALILSCNPSLKKLVGGALACSLAIDTTYQKAGTEDAIWWVERTRISRTCP